MVFNPATDFIGLWRNTAGTVSKLEMPGLDYVVAALARTGVINLAVSATAPVVNQSTTVWLQAATPSSSGEGTLRLWNPITSAYAAATPALFLALLQASAGQNGTSWYVTTGGAPLNTVGNNGDFSIRTDEPGGIYGPKALGAWPATPIAGTTDIVSSIALDNTFGTTQGQLVFRGPTVWQPLALSSVGTVLTPIGGLPAWENLSTLLDAVFGAVQGSIMYRDAALWSNLLPGVAGQVLATNGISANPSWVPKTPEFLSGTVMLFQQTAAPVGWTKQVLLNDCALRVTSGAVSTTAGTPFSTVFAQTAVGNTTITTATMPSHGHSYFIFSLPGGTGVTTGAGATATSSPSTTGSVGSDGAHTHSINLSLSYTDVIIASKN